METMADNKHISKTPQSTTFGTLDILAKNPLAAGSNELHQVKSNENETITSNIKDSSKATGDSDYQQHDDLDNDDIQRRIDIFNSGFPSDSMTLDGNHLDPRKSITSGNMVNEKENSSTLRTIDPSSNYTTQNPERPVNESVLTGHHDLTEQSSALPIQQDESLTNNDDLSDIQRPRNHSGSRLRENLSIHQRNYDTNRDLDDGFLTSQTEPMDYNQRPMSTTKPNILDETAHFTIASPKASMPQVQSPSSRQSHSPKSDDSNKEQTQMEFVGEQGQSLNDEEKQNQSFEPLKATVSSVSRRESTSETDQQQVPRTRSVIKSKSNDNSLRSSPTQLNNDLSTTNEQSKLIKLGEQLRIPTNDVDNERVNSPPPSPSTIKQMVAANPLVESNAVTTDEKYFRPPSETNDKSLSSSSVGKKKTIDNDVLSSKDRRSSNSSQQQQTALNDQKSNLSSSRKGSNVSEQQISSKKNSTASGQKAISRQASSDQQEKQIASKPSSRKTSLIEQRQTASSHCSNSSKQDEAISINEKKDARPSSKQTDASLMSAKEKQERSSSDYKRKSPLKADSARRSTNNWNVNLTSSGIADSKKTQPQNGKVSSTTDSDYENLDKSKIPQFNSSSKHNTSEQLETKRLLSSKSTTPTDNDQSFNRDKQISIPPDQLTDDGVPSSRPQSPNTEQITQRNQILGDTTAQNEKKKIERNRQLPRSNSAGSSNYIPIVDDLSIDSTSDATAEPGKRKQKRKRTKSKGKDVETSTNVVQRSIKQSNDPNEDNDPVNVNISVFLQDMTEKDDNETAQTNIKPKSQKKQQLIKASKDHDRHTQSDTEQIMTEKQKKQRRPKRISRTTQTYECVFRRIECGEHEELRPTTNTEKNIQTRKSQLHPRSKSPRKNHTIYLSNDAFKVKEISPKQLPQAPHNASVTSIVARSSVPQDGKILVLRPTLPLHHANATNTERVWIQCAIDLLPNEGKPNDSLFGQRNKSNTLKQSDPTNMLPTIFSSSSTANVLTNKSNTKNKTIPNGLEERLHQRKSGGAT